MNTETNGETKQTVPKIEARKKTDRQRKKQARDSVRVRKKKTDMRQCHTVNERIKDRQTIYRYKQGRRQRHRRRDRQRQTETVPNKKTERQTYGNQNT